jgi:uncharacterized protein YuzE
LSFGIVRGADVREVSEGIAVDVGADGNPVGIDIDGASQRLDLSTLELIALPSGTTCLIG